MKFINKIKTLFVVLTLLFSSCTSYKSLYKKEISKNNKIKLIQNSELEVTEKFSLSSAMLFGIVFGALSGYAYYSQDNSTDSDEKLDLGSAIAFPIGAGLIAGYFENYDVISKEHKHKKLALKNNEILFKWIEQYNNNKNSNFRFFDIVSGSIYLIPKDFSEKNYIIENEEDLKYYFKAFPKRNYEEKILGKSAKYISSAKNYNYIEKNASLDLTVKEKILKNFIEESKTFQELYEYITNCCLSDTVKKIAITKGYNFLNNLKKLDPRKNTTRRSNMEQFLTDYPIDNLIAKIKYNLFIYDISIAKNMIGYNVFNKAYDYLEEAEKSVQNDEDRKILNKTIVYYNSKHKTYYSSEAKEQRREQRKKWNEENSLGGLFRGIIKDIGKLSGSNNSSSSNSNSSSSTSSKLSNTVPIYYTSKNGNDITYHIKYKDHYTDFIYYKNGKYGSYYDMGLLSGSEKTFSKALKRALKEVIYFDDISKVRELDKYEYMDN